MAQNNDLEFISALADIMQNTGLTKISVKKKECEIEMAREIHAPQMAYSPQPHIMHHAPVTAPQPAGDAPVVAKTHTGTIVKSPVVGTVYLQPKPGEPAYIKIGDKVTEGQILMIVEAMKVMNPITSAKAGVVMDILVDDTDPVQFDQPLAVIE